MSSFLRISCVIALVIGFGAAPAAFAVDPTPAELAAMKTQLAEERAGITALENEYLASLRTLQTQSFSPDEVRRKLTDFLSGLSAAERDAVNRGRVDAFTAANSERYRDLLAELTDWSKAQRAHQLLIDRLNQVKTDYFIRELRYHGAVSYQALMGSTERLLSPAEQTRLIADHVRVEEAAADYLAQLGKYGTPKDTFRLAATRKFFASAKRYFKTWDSLTSSPGEKLRRFFSKLRLWPKEFLDKLKLLSLAPDAVKLGKDIFFAGGGKINATLNRAFLKAAKLRGYDVHVTGTENLLRADGKTVNIVTKVHRGPILDNMVLAKLGLPDYVFVTSFGSVMPESFSRRLVDNPGLAFVGPGFPNGIDTVTGKAIANSGHVMVNYAEGSIGNFGETRPIAEKFSTGVIPALRANGYKVNVIPVTSQGASFMKQDFGENLLFGKILDARVHAPLDDTAISLLEASGKLDLIGVWVRATWLSELETDGEGRMIEGALTLRGMEEMTLKYLEAERWGTQACQSLLKE